MRAKLSINDLSRLMQLSKKYMADELHSEVSEHLRILYPSDRSGYTPIDVNSSYHRIVDSTITTPLS